MEEMKYIIFRVGQEKYGMNISCVNGIEQEYRIVPVPNAPESISGIINLRGNVIPVYSLADRFGFGMTEKTPTSSLLVTNSSGTTLAYEIDEVIGIELMEEDHIVEMPFVASNKETNFMKKVLHVGQDIVIVIDVDSVLSEEVRDSILKMVDEHKKQEE